MATYCGTADCILITRDWTDLTTDGTTSYATDYITDASEWIDAEINDWRIPVSPTSSGGTVYDYWIKKACARFAVWTAYDSIMRDKYEANETPYWQTYRDDAKQIMDDLRDRLSTMQEDPSIWERGIAEAQGVANGTVSAPYVGIMISNARVHSGVYTADDDIPRTYVVELDGTGTSIYGQTYKYKELGGTEWILEDQTIRPNEWHYLENGVRVCWPSEANAAVEAEMQWKIQCYPARGGNYSTDGVTSWDMVIG